MNIELDYPEGFKLLTEEEKGTICNGAGSANGIKVPNTMWGLDCKMAFDIHDYDYWRGKSDKEKREADRRMLENLMIIINNEGGFFAWLRRYRAVTYYNAVVELGDNAFWYGKEKPSL